MTRGKAASIAVKASRYLTHVKRLLDIEQGIRRFHEPLLELLPEGRHTIELRHESWFVAPVMDALREHDVALTIGDHPDRPFDSHQATASWRFIRFHFGTGANGRYSGEQLSTWARRIGQWRREHDIYAYFSNDWEGYAPENADDLASRLPG